MSKAESDRLKRGLIGFTASTGPEVSSIDLPQVYAARN
jgi:hypothetical protein